MNDSIRDLITENVTDSFVLRVVLTYDMTFRQERFCHEFIVDKNATAAAKRASYSEQSARQIGSELLHNPYIALYIRELQDRLLERVNDWPKGAAYRGKKKW